MARELWDIYDLESKIDWEGGYSSAIEYGIDIDDYDVPEDLKEKWEEMVSLYSEYATVADEVDYMIRQVKKEKSNNDE